MVGEESASERRTRGRPPRTFRFPFPFSQPSASSVSPPSLTPVTPLAPPTLVDVIPAVK